MGHFSAYLAPIHGLRFTLFLLSNCVFCFARFRCNESQWITNRNIQVHLPRKPNKLILLIYVFLFLFLWIFVYLVPHSNSFGGGLNRRSTPPNEYQTVQSNNFDGNHAEGNLFIIITIKYFNYFSLPFIFINFCVRFFLLFICTQKLQLNVLLVSDWI